MNHKIIAIHQPNFLPWIGFFYKMLKSDVFVFLDNVQFSKNSYQNRVKIKSSQGAMWLTVPVLHKFGQLTKEVKINNREQWREKHLKTLELNYKKASFFKPVFELLREIYFKEEWELLVDFNIELIFSISKFLEIETEMIRATSLNVSGKSTDLLINIAKELNASIYLSGKGGANYQDEKKFRANGIELKYSDFTHPVYPQLWGEFIEGLSIIDLLFNCGEKSLEYIRNEIET
jgi:hypothetical protein